MAGKSCKHKKHVRVLADNVFWCRSCGAHMLADRQWISPKVTEMNKEFEMHMLNEQGKEKAKKIAEAFDLLLETLCPSDVRLLALCPPGRELSLVRTKLEEACFFAKKSMAAVSANQEKP